jgi:hypothetical protein
MEGWNDGRMDGTEMLLKRISPNIPIFHHSSIPASDFGSLFDATEHLFEARFIEPDHHLIAGSNHGNASRSR